MHQLISSLLIFDTDAGYRRFLGADPTSTLALKKLCDIEVEFINGFVSSPGLTVFSEILSRVISNPDETLDETQQQVDIIANIADEDKEPSISIPQPSIRFYPDMLDWVTDQIFNMIGNGTRPGDIVVLAPYLSDALRYTLVDRLNQIGIPSHSHRPSRSLREEPVSQCLLTLAKLAHPHWNLLPLETDTIYAILQAIGDMDLVRAELLVKNIYKLGKLLPFESIHQQAQERITYLFGNRYEQLRLWIENYIENGTIEFDHFLGQIFGELLSQPGFGLYANYTSGTVVASLMESVKNFRWTVGKILDQEGVPLGKEYLEMLEDGVIASQYLVPWQFIPEDSVFIAPAYTFLLSNRPVDYQIWLNVGSRGWYERLFQPLTHPYVLHHRWPMGKPWTDLDEIETARETLNGLSLGLLRRCRKGVTLGISELTEQGFEFKGELLRAIDKALRILQISNRNFNKLL
jgi:hypothetical protein